MVGALTWGGGKWALVPRIAADTAPPAPAKLMYATWGYDVCRAGTEDSWWNDVEQKCSYAY